MQNRWAASYRHVYVINRKCEIFSIKKVEIKVTTKLHVKWTNM